MILIDIFKDEKSYTITEMTINESWEYEDSEYVRHYTDNNDILHIEFTDGCVEMPVGCCILNVMD